MVSELITPTEYGHAKFQSQRFQRTGEDKLLFNQIVFWMCSGFLRELIVESTIAVTTRIICT